ncbi:MAG: hypothetical protein ABI852_16160 [Gemmatimonadaceae bacterium]
MNNQKQYDFGESVMVHKWFDVAVRLCSVSAIAGALLVPLLVAPTSTQAQPRTTQSTVPVRELSAPVISKQTFSNIFNVRQIADGQVLVNDGLRRQVVLLDAKLAPSRVVLDSVTSPNGERYGAVAAPLLAYLGDSSLFVDREAQALLVIDPNGKIVRTVASPAKGRQFTFLWFSASAVDHNGNLLFRAVTGTPAKRIGDTTSSTVVMEVRQPDSTYILRANFDSRMTDTIARLKQIGGMRTISTRPPNSRPTQRLIVSPIETLDDWTTLSDGTVAIVRGGDYHVDFLRPNGKQESGAKLPFDWKPIADADKQKIIDSTRKAVDDAAAAGGTSGSQAARDAQLKALIGSIESMPGAAPVVQQRALAVPAPSAAVPLIQYEFVPLNEMPSYYPPLRLGYTKGDSDGNLWILPTTSAQSKAGELVYDVVSSKGAMVERVRVPLGRLIAGFGSGGVVYLMNKDAAGLWHLERTKVLR